MRILEVTDGYPPPLVGGRDLVVQLLSRELARRGHEVDVVTLAGRGGSKTERDGNVRVHRLAGWSRILPYVDAQKPFHPTLPDPGLVRALARLLKERKPQIVHAHSWFLYSLLPLLPSPETRLVVWAHDYGLICPKGTLVYRGGGVCTGPRYTKCVVCSSGQYGVARAVPLTTGMSVMQPWRRRVDRYVAITRFIAEATAPHLGRGARTMDVIPPFVPDGAFRAADGGRPAFVPQEGDYLMFAGALGPHKGLDVLLEAWAGMGTKLPLVLAGIRRHDTPRSFPPAVILAEEIEREDVARGFAHSLAAVVPSVWPEPFGMVALEAMAAGRPVVASAVGGLAELVVDGATGIHVPPGDVPKLRDALELIVADAPLRARLGAAGRERAQAYSADAVVGAWEEVFREVIEQGSRG